METQNAIMYPKDTDVYVRKNTRVGEVRNTVTTKDFPKTNLEPQLQRIKLYHTAILV